MPRFGTDSIATGRDTPDLLDVPAWDAVKATAEETFGSSPTEAYNRAYQVHQGRKTPDELDLRLPFLREDRNASRFVKGVTTSPLLTKEQAQAKIDAAGLTGKLTVGDQGENEAALDLLIEYKGDELKNGFILDRYRGGVAGGALTITTALATSLADPLNIGSAFVPVVGEARYAQILGRAGQSMFARAGARAGVGAVEGTVGAGIVEPIIYQSKQAIQADYDTTDSLMNIGFGAVFGGVLQPAAGGIADVFARRAGMGAWAENVNADLQAIDPEVPAGWVRGGGTQFVDGQDYVRGQWAVAEADALKAGAAPFDNPDAGQLGASYHSDSGAPVMDSTGAVVNGNRRLATILADYSTGGAEYRLNLLEQAERYGLDSDQLSGMTNPVLMRVEAGREAGAWGEYQKIAQNSPQARAARVPFESPDTVAAAAFTARAKGLGVPDEAAKALAPVAPRDDVTGFYDGRAEGMKADTVRRALAHMERTGEEGVWVSADIANLGGLNAAMGNQAEPANVHFRAMAGLMKKELDAVGADITAFRTGGDELGAVVMNGNIEQVDAALTRAEAALSKYAKDNGLTDIPHGKRSGEYGVGLHFGMAELRKGETLSDIFNRADDGVDFSKNGGTHGRQAQVEAFRAARSGAVPGRSGKAAQGAGAADGAVRPQAKALTPEQQQAATGMGVAQAVNGERIDVLAVGELDGTRAGVERFLEAKRRADANEVTVRDRQVADLDRMRASLAKFSPEEAAKLDKDVAELEASLRQQVKDAGGDEADIDAALAEVADITEAADLEAKAMRGVALCMMRSA